MEGVAIFDDSPEKNVPEVCNGELKPSVLRIMNVRAATIILVAVLTLGCKGKSGPTNTAIIGTWTTDQDTYKDGQVKLGADGTLLETGTTDKGSKTVIAGYYELNGNTFIRRIRSVRITPAANADVETLKEAETLNKAVTAAGDLPDDVTKFSWKDSNTFTLTSANGSATVQKRISN